jgi:hypothetical protein
MIHSLHHMIGSPNCSTGPIRVDLGNGDVREAWVRAVPLPFFGGLFDRIRDAWAVIKGEAYAVRWPEPGDLEVALKGGRTLP